MNDTVNPSNRGGVGAHVMKSNTIIYMYHMSYVLYNIH